MCQDYEENVSTGSPHSAPENNFFRITFREVRHVNDCETRILSSDHCEWFIICGYPARGDGVAEQGKIEKEMPR